MVSATDELMAEVAEAEAAGLKAEELSQLRGEVEGSAAAGLGMSYEVPDTEKASWIAAWRLSIDHNGEEYGEPTMLAKGGLGSYLGKKRPVDGGRLFTLKMPAKLAPLPTFGCFAAPNFCKFKADTKMNLIDHIEAAHPREARGFAEEIEILRKAAKSENSALQSMIAQMAAQPDPGTVTVAPSVKVAYDESVAHVDTTAGIETTTLTIAAPKCDLCAWPVGSAKWTDDKPPTQMALKMHIFAKHKDEVE